MDGQFLGQIIGAAFGFAPRGWDTCAGQLLSIAQNQALFALLGTVYGGNGVSTFSLPDLRGRTPINWGQGLGLQNYTLGEQSGTQTVTMLAANVPLHTHTLMASNQTANAAAPGGNALAIGSVEGNPGLLYGSAAGATMAPGVIANTGGNVPITILQPYNTLQYCIAVQGIFPSRN